MLKYGINDLWPTKVLLGTISNRELVDQAAQTIMSSYNLSTPPSDFQGSDILNDCEGLKEFRDLIIIPTFTNYLQEVYNLDIKTLDFKLSSWISGAYSSYMMPVHNHSGACLSSVFYLCCEEEDSGGSISFVDPRSNANRGYISEFKSIFEPETIQPKTGEYLIFPSFLYHHVLPFNGKLRLAMPVDFYVEGKK